MGQSDWSSYILFVMCKVGHSVCEDVNPILEECVSLLFWVLH